MNVLMKWTTRNDGDMNIRENRRNFLKANRLNDKKDIVVMQVHGNTIAVINDAKEEVIADGMITNNKNFALFVRVADCVPILFHDTQNDVIGVVHAGREGTFQEITSKMINAFTSQFNSTVSHINVYIGPSIGVCCYEVSQEIVDKVSKEYGENFVENRNINLQKMNEYQLLKNGVLKENIIFQSICTKCNTEKYFSYRNSQDKERFAGVISLL